MKMYLVAAGMCLVSSPALAQDFSGFRVEGIGGYDRVDLGIGEGAEDEGNTDGVFYGAAAGYDWQSGNVLFGLEAEVSSSTIGDEIDVIETIDGSVYDGTISLEDGLNWYAGGRIGAVTGANLFYAKAGYARATIDLDIEGTVDGEAGSDQADFNFSGLRLGVGYERSFGSAYGKIEYRYTNYSDADAEYDGETIDLESAFGEFDAERHQIVAGVGVRF